MKFKLSLYLYLQMKITDTIRQLEDLTRQVSVLGILSDNENYGEMNPSELKFVLLPFMIGSLWQLSRSESRESACQLSKVYFRDYLKRCFNYEIISKLPPEAQPEGEDDDESEDKKRTSNKSKSQRINSDELRAIKIQRFKEAKMLDEQLTSFYTSHLVS